MKITRKTWMKYVERLAKTDEKAYDLIADYLMEHEILSDAGFEDFVDYMYAVVTKYSEGSSAIAAEAYDALARAQGQNLEPAVPAEPPTYHEVAKTTHGIRKQSMNPNSYAQSGSRLVKRTGLDTMMNNALRDGAQFAWITSGDTCPFCLMLSSNGWQYASKKAIKNGHASHVHANCDCTYAVRFSDDVDVEGYHPDQLREQYLNAGDNQAERLNALRRAQYEQNKDFINAQKRLAYAKRNGIKIDRPEPLSRAYINQRDRLYKNLQNVGLIDGYEDFAVHGVPEESLVEYETTNGVMVRYNAKEIAAMIREDPSYQGGSIRLLSCGAGSSKSSFAEELAEELGVEVLAPTETLWVAENGELFISDNETLVDMWYNNGKIDNSFHSTGHWKTFKPNTKD